MRPFPGRNRTKFRGLRTQSPGNRTENPEIGTESRRNSTTAQEKRTAREKGHFQACKDTQKEKWINCTKTGRNARKPEILNESRRLEKELDALNAHLLDPTPKLF